jgi:hypothetical protein
MKLVYSRSGDLFLTSPPEIALGRLPLGSMRIDDITSRLLLPPLESVKKGYNTSME